MSAAILHLENVSAGYKAVPTIRGISLTHDGGRRSCDHRCERRRQNHAAARDHGADRDDGAAAYRFRSRAISSLSTHDRARLGIGYAPKGGSCFRP